MRLKDKKVLIVGVARTGMAVAKFLVARGAKVTITDLKTKLELKDELKSLSELKKIKYELGRHSIKQFVGADLSGANLSNASLIGTHFMGANTDGCIGCP